MAIAMPTGALEVLDRKRMPNKGLQGQSGPPTPWPTESNGGRVTIDINQVRLVAVDLVDSLRRDWVRIGWALPEERADIHKHMRWCLEEMARLSTELEADRA